jgi:hypothetical protein
MYRLNCALKGNSASPISVSFTGPRDSADSRAGRRCSASPQDGEPQRDLTPVLRRSVEPAGVKQTLDSYGLKQTP